ncbi:glutamine synthetase [Rhizobium sullae]|uniref:Glutamine synthetase n=1 Tax=Rhizobium sullae TaxID=50338 RepID=A0A2N0D043_RHISU|nr:glutamine synthetase family protein [Rhizobium sullae]PKA39481.1 glutamine synthetase [Rhizobium sullae]
MNEIAEKQPLPINHIGRPNFAAEVGIDSQERREAIAALVALIEAESLDVIRVGFVDTNGIVRVRPVEARHFGQAATNGVPFTTALFAMDSANFIVQDVFASDGGFGRASMGGAGDMLAMPAPDTFRILPWAERTGFILSDLYLKDGLRCPLDPRRLMQEACASLANLGFAFVSGVEIEAHVFRITDPKAALADCTQPATPPAVEALRHGFQHLSEAAADGLDIVLSRLRKAIRDVGLPLRTLEVEWGPGQIEITLDPLVGVAAADAAVVLRSTVKQTCQRMGLLASFMAKPGLPNAFSSGWHLHQSLALHGERVNSFTDAYLPISETGLHYVGGLLRHARAGAAFTNPTINGYKRLNATPLSPKRACWALDNKGAMLRVMGGTGDPTVHIENRIGEPAANPYLYMASQIVAGLDGIANKYDPGEPAANPYDHQGSDKLPMSLAEAVEATSASMFFRDAFGNEYIDHFVALKRHEIGRFEAYVTDWEHREYFELI